MIKLDIEDGQFVITASTLERDLVKWINGLKSSGANRWTAPLRWAIYVDAASTILKYKGEVSAEAKAWGSAEGNRVAELVKRKHGNGETRMLGNVELFGSQVADAEWLLEYDDASGFLFSDMRTGKTFTVCETINLLGPDAFPVLIACPPHITFEWDLALEQAFPEKNIVVLSKGMTAPQRKKALQDSADIVVIGYNNLAKHAKLAYYGGLKKPKADKERSKGFYDAKELNEVGFKTVIADEAHNIKNPEAQAPRALWVLGDAAQHRIATTGTPTSRKITDTEELTYSRVDISDMWGLFRFVYPLDFPARSKFNEKYLWQEENFFGIKETLGLKPENVEYWKKVFEPMYLRRLRSIDTQKEYRVLPVELSSKEYKQYKELAEESMTEVDGELVFAADHMSLRQQLIELCVMSDAMSDAAVDWIEESDDKAIIFVTRIPAFRKLEDMLLEKGVRFVSFPGGLNDEQKKQIKRVFNENDDVRLVLCALKATNAGIDLSAARRTLYFGISDDPTHMQQSEDRALGPTQTAQVYELTYLVPKDTVLCDIAEAFADKDANPHVLFSDPGWVKKHLHV